MIFTISARMKPQGQSVLDFLASNYPHIDLKNIDSVFGFLEVSTLYGGRSFVLPELTPDDVAELYSARIGVRIPLTNHYVEQNEYEGNKSFLERYHREGNAVIITNDKLAEWIRKDFPKYRIEASVIKDIDTHGKIAAALDLYDTVVLPMHMNEQHDFLASIKDKDRITLFASAGCALTCPSKICYPSFSKMNKFRGALYQCSQPLKDRQQMGMVDFDLERLSSQGFERYKLLRPRPEHLTKSGWSTGW